MINFFSAKTTFCFDANRGIVACNCVGHSHCLAHFWPRAAFMPQINKSVSSVRTGDKLLEQVLNPRYF